jgi:hypothetical protein
LAETGREGKYTTTRLEEKLANDGRIIVDIHHMIWLEGDSITVTTSGFAKA